MVQCLGFMVRCLVFMVRCLKGSGVTVWSLGFRVNRKGIRIEG